MEIGIDLMVLVANTENCSCLRNVVTLFHYVEKERAWRKEQGRPQGFETLDARKPIGENIVIMRVCEDVG